MLGKLVESENSVVVEAAKISEQKFIARNNPFSNCFEPHCESDASCIVFILGISFHSHANKSNALHLASLS